MEWGSALQLRMRSVQGWQGWPGGMGAPPCLRSLSVLGQIQHLSVHTGQRQSPSAEYFLCVRHCSQPLAPDTMFTPVLQTGKERICPRP